jgi:4-amino-4-deoxy-L-arabinose transferase-like glycosyltransferase
LTAPALPVVLVWILLYNRTGGRWTKCVAFLAAAVIPFLPVLVLFAKAPRPVWFNLVGYQLFYRRSGWERATSNDLDVLTSWVDSGPALLLGLLALTGLLVVRNSDWDRDRRSEFYLCAWLVGAMGLEVAAAHPTFVQYFVLVVPFLAILAVAGLYEFAKRIYRPDLPLWPVAALTLLLSLGLARALREDGASWNWGDMQEIANKVQQVTAPQETLWASEHIYFLTRRPPPDGMEFAAAQKVEMTLSIAAPLHILPKPELDRRVRAGMFNTVAICDDDRVEELGLTELYAKNAEIEGCTVFWERKPASRDSARNVKLPHE